MHNFVHIDLESRPLPNAVQAVDPTQQVSPFMDEATDPSADQALIRNGLAMAPVFAAWGRELIDRNARKAEVRRYKRGDAVATGRGPDRRLSILFGVPDGDGLRLRLRLTQDDLADMLCVSRQTVNKELKRLEESGVIASTYKTVTVMDREALERIVRGGY